jgi:hypothetical protein
VPLHVSQSAAIEHFASYAKTRRANAQRTIADILAMSNLEPAAFQRGMQNLRQHARVVLHFHPDRPNTKLQTVAESLLECGIYQSQFQTLISNGSVSAYPGGERDQWEQRLFGGAYHHPGTTAAHRPKYGALDVLRHSDGPSPAFGSCYFVLAQPVSERATFTYLDSHTEPPERGTLDELDDIVAAMFKDSFMRDFTLGQANLRPGRLLEQLLTRLPQPYEDASTRPPSRNLGHYIEAQVHGEVSLREDVETLVIDPSFRGSALAQTLEALCDRYEIVSRWHQGFRLSAVEVPNDFRGATMPSLAARVAVDGMLDAAAIGAAVLQLKRNPDAWADRGAVAHVLQELKLLWQVLVRFGQPSE